MNLQMPPHSDQVKNPFFSIFFLKHNNKLEDCQMFSFFILTEGKEPDFMLKKIFVC